MAKNLIRIFLSTPSDIVDERHAIASLVAEINDVVTFLAPERDVRLELVQYETHAYPDIGKPQKVIDRQIPNDYDIYLGVMWKRCGTPTDTAESGTVHEFNRALTQRESTGRPTIKFYFGTEDVGMPTTEEEVAQLLKVVRFRERLQTIGLTVTYPKRSEFRDRARVGVLRAIADVLREELPQRSDSQDKTKIPSELKTICERYDDLRLSKSSRHERTSQMTALFQEMQVIAPYSFRSLELLKLHSSAGHRLAAIAILKVLPSRENLERLADRLDPEKKTPFVGFQSTAALLQAVRSLPATDADLQFEHVTRAKALAERNPHDPPRILAFDYALQELQVKRQTDYIRESAR